MKFATQISPLLNYYLYVGTPSGVHIFDHLLWPIFPSSMAHHIYKLQLFTFHGDFLGQLNFSPKTMLDHSVNYGSMRLHDSGPIKHFRAKECFLN